ncbi:MAG: adenylate/guanylate cyclase domain-containing protein [Flavobacteriales bacterium]|nr:adenylate/guanylate cyclase domain-containing protein [Flavobacteriales bacterium]
MDSLVAVLKADSQQYQLVTAPTELWPIEQEARTPHQRALAGIARAHFLIRQPDIGAALSVLDRAVGLLEGGPHERTLAVAHSVQGRAELVRNNVTGAIVQYERALRITARLPYPELEAKLQQDIGTAYGQLEDLAQARVHYEAVLDLPQNTFDRFWTLGALVETNLQLGDIGDAKHYLQKMKALGDSAGLNPAYVELDRGELALAEGAPRAAIGHFNTALARFKADRNVIFQAWTLSRLSKAHLAAGDHEKAVALAEQGVAVSERGRLLKELQDNLGELHRAHAASGNRAAAYDHFTRYIALRDSATGSKASALLAASMLRTQMERQARTDSLLRAEQDLRKAERHHAELGRQRSQRNISLIAGLALLLFTATVFRQRDRIKKERDRSEELLLNILPEEIATELKEKGASEARQIEQATVLFSDFKGFTQLSEQLSAQELVAEINTCFRAFDGILARRGVEKIKTIGDAYMAAGGMPIPSADSARGTVLAALEMQAFMRTYTAGRKARGKPAFEMRVGIHTGPVVAGIVGVRKFQYDIWGDTVNTASRMESAGEVGRVNISAATYALVKDTVLSAPLSIASDTLTTDDQQLATVPAFTFTPRGLVQAKGKGAMEMYFVEPA